MTKDPGARVRKGTSPCCGAIHLLGDEPAGEDAFGSHQALAEAMAHLIETEAGGKAIALVGGWGRGKSSVVKLLGRDLEARDAGTVFLFDKWAHQGDSLRRALVEEFWDWAKRGRGRDGLPWVDEKGRLEIQARVDDLGQRHEEQRVRLTLWGRAMALFLALVPVGLALAARAGLPGPWFRAGVALAALPLLLLLFCLVCSITHFDQALGPFLGQAETRGSSTSDPTSIEFASLFEAILQEVLGARGGPRRLVLVLDNLDRTGRRDAMSAFATLRVLLEPRVGQPWRERFWLLVPYDPASLKGARSGGPGGPERTFQQKFFQVRFRVPRAVLLKWREYLKDQLGAALPGHREDRAALESVCRLFELYAHAPTAQGQDLGRYRFPTPREIKLFVNRVATLHVQWACENADACTDSARELVPFILQAGFALCRGRVRGDLSEYVPGAGGKFLFTDAELRLIDVKEWQRHVAAMWYGVPQSEAMQMLLRPQVFDALSQGAVRYASSGPMPYEGLTGIRDAEGFWTVVGDVSRAAIGSPDSAALGRCARVLGVLAKWREAKDPWRRVWGDTQREALVCLSAALPPGQSDVLEGTGGNFAAALRTPEAGIELAPSALRALGRLDPGSDQNRGVTWARETAAVICAAAERGWTSGIRDFALPSSPDRFLLLVGAAARGFGMSEMGAADAGSAGAAQEVLAVLREYVGSQGLGEEAIQKALQEAFGKANLIGLAPEYVYAFAWLAPVFPGWRLEPAILPILQPGRMQEFDKMDATGRRFFAKALENLKERTQVDAANWWSAHGVGVQKLIEALRRRPSGA